MESSGKAHGKRRGVGDVDGYRANSAGCCGCQLSLAARKN